MYDIMYICIIIKAYNKDAYIYNNSVNKLLS